LRLTELGFRRRIQLSVNRLGWLGAGLAAWAAALGCDNGSAVPPGSSEGPSGRASGGASSDGAVTSQFWGGGSYSGGSGGADAGKVMVDRPLVLCGQTAGGAAGYGAETGSAGIGASGAPPWDDTCSLPPSRCADESTLVYYQSGTCMAGHCVWTIESVPCPYGCYQGGCVCNCTF
jgi:hypothetical protein